VFQRGGCPSATHMARGGRIIAQQQLAGIVSTKM
jgi:hypothetical protein